VHLAGIPVTDDAVLELARRVEDEALAGRLDTAYSRMTRVLALTIAEREVVLDAIAEDPPAASKSCAACCCASTRGGNARAVTAHSVANAAHGWARTHEPRGDTR
jgi:hypothetical protein